jgi:hypothetical protein
VEVSIMRRLPSVLLLALLCFAPASQAGFKIGPGETKPKPVPVEPKISPVPRQRQPQPPAAGDLQLMESEFGVIRKLSDGRYQMLPSDVVPYIDGLRFGWQLRFQTKREKLTVKEELILPSKPKAWGSEDGGDPTFKISPDGKTATSEKEVEVDEQGIVQNIWSIAKGDPVGNYEIRISIDGKLVHTFKFKVTPME